MKMDIRCLNWFESKSEQRFLYLKARKRNGETIFIRFQHYVHYVVTDEVYKSISPVPSRSRYLGEMNLMEIDEIVGADHCIRDRKTVTTGVWLLEEYKKKSYPDVIMGEFLNISWFFISNNISPDGCYSIDENNLVYINPGCYHCNDPLKCFSNQMPRFDVNRSYLFLDIECQFEKKFPSVFTNPVSHISFCYIDRNNNEFKFTLINEDMLEEGDREEAVRRGCKRIDNPKDIDYKEEFILCSELVMLLITKRLLELSFDFIVTFNGHNFDLRYISSRLNLLSGEKIIFKSPDKTEHVHLCIYERNLTSHKGGGGMANTTYHVNNNNGTIFFDMYSFIQKSERLDSYKLDSISKNAFYCSVKVVNRDGHTYTFVGNKTSDPSGRTVMFGKVLSTGNYITIDDDICKILDKTIDENEFVVKMVYNHDLKIGETITLSFGKDDVDLTYMYKNYDLEVAIEMGNYCLHDACLCKYLWDYYGVETKIDAAAVTYVLPQTTVFEYRASTLIKGPLLKLLLETRTALCRYEKKNRYPYVGGKVFAPKQKLFSNNVLIFDYNSLYPNVCLFGNLSPETLVGVIVSTNKLEAEINKQELLKKYPPPRYITVMCEPRSKEYISELAIFDRETEGIIPKLLRTFLAERAKYKKKLKEATTSTDKAIYESMQYTYKIVANSVYGLMGFRNSALYSYASAKSCTAIGRSMITYLDSVLNGAKFIDGNIILANAPINPFYEDGRERNTIIGTSINRQADYVFRSVYGDTDSVFLEINCQDVTASVAIAKELERIINEKVLFSTFKIEFEAVYKNLIMQSKKKYTTTKISASISAPERINKGTSETRRDVSRFHKSMIKIYKTRIADMLSDGTMSSQQMCVDILKSLEAELRLEFDLRTLPLEMFLLSRMHHCNYKAPDNPNMNLVLSYNKNNPETIEIGERYFFAYICKLEPWKKKLVNIKTYEQIVDRGFKLAKDERIFYEVYFKRLATELVNLLDNRALSTVFFERLFGTKPLFYNSS
uniref:DNA polymerase n=1 Tax=Baiomys poxvirus TaxID=2203081 RepID=A0A2U8U607_9POXV|nr:DNA polymerase [Baiomys poxvirus]